MNRAAAIEAIQQATDIFVQVITSKRSDGTDGATALFRTSRADALAALQAIDDPDCLVNVHATEEGARVTIGSEGTAAVLADLMRASEFSHNDNNNGNF